GPISTSSSRPNGGPPGCNAGGSRVREALALALAELDPPDLARDGLRKLRDELDLSRVLVGCGRPLHVLLDVARELVRRLEPGLQRDERLDDLSAKRVGLADDGGLRDRAVLDDRRLDLERADPVRARGDHVVRPSDEPQVPVLVLAREV